MSDRSGAFPTTQGSGPSGSGLKHSRGLVRIPLIGMVIGGLAGLGVALLQPRVYESVATIRFHQDGIVFGFGFFGENPTGPAASHLLPWSLPVPSPAAAGAACDQLALDKIWELSREEAIESVLASCLSEPGADVDLVRLRVRDRDPALAHDLAEAIVTAFAEAQRTERGRRLDVAIQALEAEVQMMEAVVERKRAVVIAAGQAEGKGDEADRSHEERRLELLNEKKWWSIALERLEQLRGETRLQYAATLTLQENGVPQFYDELLAERKALEDLKQSGLGAIHPSVLRTQDRLVELDNLLRAAIVALRELAAGESEVLEGRLREMEEAPNETNRPDGSLSAYTLAKDEYDTAHLMLRDLQGSASLSRIRLRAAPEPVTIDEPPCVPAKPVSGKRGPAIVWGSVGGLLAGLVLALALSLRRTG